MKDLYLDCFSGIAGDMLVGALLDLGASFESVRDGLAALGVSGYRLERSVVRRHAIAATKFDVILDGHGPGDPGAVVHDHGHPHPHDHGHDRRHDRRHDHGPSRGLREIRAILDAPGLPPRVRARALAAFTRLAESEAKVHGSTPDEVHFHEVGAVDAICDIVGAALALESLGVERIFVGPLRVGSGFVECAHGRMPVPAPGTLNCLAGFDVRFEQGRGELVTPTGACLVGALGRPGVPDEFVVARVGYGAGTRDPADTPNVLRAVLGAAGAPDDAAVADIVELSTNLDHLPPTQVAVAVEAAFAAGAIEAFTVPCTMKKGRPGHLLVALAPESARASVETAIFRETGTLGIRRHPVARTVLERRVENVTTPWGDVRVKVGTWCGAPTSVVPEFEDCRAAAARADVPVAAVLDAARRACDKFVR